MCITFIAEANDVVNLHFVSQLRLNSSHLRDSKSDDIKVSGRVYQIRSVAGLSLFTHPESPHNLFLVVVDPLKKCVTVVKNNFTPYW